MTITVSTNSSISTAGNECLLPENGLRCKDGNPIHPARWENRARIKEKYSPKRSIVSIPAITGTQKQYHAI